MSMAEIIIRRMVAEDIEQVHALDQRSFPTPWPARSFQHELEKNQAAYLWVAEKMTEDINKEIIGAIVEVEKDSEAWSSEVQPKISVLDQLLHVCEKIGRAHV